MEVKDIRFKSLTGGETAAYLVVPPGAAKCAGALFVHWYESEAKNSNRTQFLDEAVELGRHGLISLLVETPWSEPTWFQKRDVGRDFENSVQTVKDLRRALDVLLSEPRVDPKRVGYIGHDFGAMYGILMTAVDRRATAVAFQAGTNRFSDWFLFNQKSLSEEGKAQVVARLQPLDPLSYIGQLKGTPLLLQYADRDFYVPKERAEVMARFAGEPKKVLYYDAGHALNEKASADRRTWLRQQLKLR